MRLLLVTSLVAFMCLPGTARADDGEDPFDAPAVAQYVEAIPTASGPRQAARPPQHQARALPSATTSAIRRDAGELDDALIQLATSAAYGAPTGTSLEPVKRGGPGRYQPGTNEQHESFGAALADALGQSAESRARLAPLGAILIAVTLVAVLAAARRRHDSR